MKKFLLALLFSARCLATDLTLDWNASATPGITSHNVYERTGAGPAYGYTKLGSTTPAVRTFPILNVTEAVHVYVVTSVISYTAPVVIDVESAYSAFAWWAPRPGAPTNLRVTPSNITAALEDFQEWPALLASN